MANAAKKSTKPEPEVHVHDLSKLRGKLKVIGGSMSDDWNNILANQTIKTLWLKHSDAEEIRRQRHATVDALIGIKPRDELEGHDRRATRRLPQRLDGMLSARHDRRADIRGAARRISIRRTSSRGPTRHCWKPSTGIVARGSRRSRSSTSTFMRAARPSSGTSRPRGVGSHRNQRINPMQLPIHQAPRCGARTRRGSPCQSPAMPNGRCRMHGGKSPGAPKGNRNAWKHGHYSAEAIARRRSLAALIRTARQLMG